MFVMKWMESNRLGESQRQKRMLCDSFISRSNVRFPIITLRRTSQNARPISLLLSYQLFVVIKNRVDYTRPQ